MNRSLSPVWLLVAALAGCGSDATGPDGDGARGQLEVTVEIGGWGQAGVTVGISGPRATRSVVTDADGVALFQDVPEGSYQVSVSGLDEDAMVTAGTGTASVEALERTTLLVEGVFDPGRFTAVSTGGSFSCGLNELRHVYCWGFGDDGELGNGTFAGRARPVRVRVQGDFQDVTTGLSHACALATDGRAWCWGSNGVGQLGRAVFADQLSRASVPDSVLGGVRFSDLEAGAATTCGLERDSGRAYCWGFGRGGMLGNGTTESSAVPGPVSGGESFVALSANDAWAGDEAVAGRTADGRVFLWGALPPSGPSWLNFAGAAPTEVPLSGPAVLNTPLCALLEDATVTCWPNLYGSVPEEVLAKLEATAQEGVYRYDVDNLDEPFLKAGMPCMPEDDGFVCLRDWFEVLPVLEFGGETVTQVSTKGYSGCALTGMGRVYCWSELFFETQLTAGPGS